ncbi:tRNA dihydrouridine synthase DusB [Acidihalobacter aeolianus]|uniref:tRNA-dihydrouridine synthase B n=1 Tax=Acidihalobacter aeolianus TaxID=2792603 RepID=A0A1D8K5C2_9GAMM|nr:tRNA dihydrouridine synthase DusB [Acidihalobacter aeolianus]AOV16156.1 tRNA dihydrouridine synthase DusB [Acidihalobacter aeolianus]
MQIGAHTISNRLILAPMAGVTDRPFRNLCRRLGAGMAVSEMVTVRPDLRGSTKTRLRLDHAGETGIRSVQIAGADPAMMAEAARINAAEGAQIIDINMGCPAKKVCNKAAGSALMRDEDLIRRILEAVVSAVEIPVTLKIRTGWSPEQRNAVRVAQIAEEVGIAALAVHGRTRACAYSGEAEYATIRAVKSAVSIPVVANGDVDTPEKARMVLDATAADALMIGRAAQGNPWIFREIERYLHTGQRLEQAGQDETRDTLLEHVCTLYDFYGEERGYRVARKHIGWYLRALTIRTARDDVAAWSKRILGAEGSTAQYRLIESFFQYNHSRGLAA